MTRKACSILIKLYTLTARWVAILWTAARSRFDFRTLSVSMKALINATDVFIRLTRRKISFPRERLPTAVFRVLRVILFFAATVCRLREKPKDYSRSFSSSLVSRLSCSYSVRSHSVQRSRWKVATHLRVGHFLLKVSSGTLPPPRLALLKRNELLILSLTLTSLPPPRRLWNARLLSVLSARLFVC